MPEFFAVYEEDFFGQERFQLGVGFANVEFCAQDGAVYLFHSLLQVGNVALRVCHNTFPVPLVYIKAVQVVQFFVASDGVHVSDDAESRIHLVFRQRDSLPFCKTVYHLGYGLVHVFDGEGYRAFNSAQVIVQA